MPFFGRKASRAIFCPRLGRFRRSKGFFTGGSTDTCFARNMMAGEEGASLPSRHHMKRFGWLRCFRYPDYRECSRLFSKECGRQCLTLACCLQLNTLQEELLKKDDQDRMLLQLAAASGEKSAVRAVCGACREHGLTKTQVTGAMLLQNLFRFMCRRHHCPVGPTDTRPPKKV